MGLHLKIEYATDLLTMEWVLSEYIKGYVHEQRQLIPANIICPDSVNPFDWAPLNFDGSKWTAFSKQYNFGFLFRTTSDELMRVCKRHKIASLGQPLEFLPGMPLVIKHTSILLEPNYKIGIATIQIILLMQGLDIVHPYIAVIGTISTPLIVMKDMGEPLSDLMQNLSFRRSWAQSTVLRRAFLTQVGISALNLVDNVQVCHNDIRPPNIAVLGDNFCLVDFDMCRNCVPTAVVSAFVPTLPETPGDSAQMMCFSVAQIVLCVFMLNSPTVFSVGDVTEALSIWRESRDSSSKIDGEFEGWVQSKGGALLEFVSALRGSAAWPPGVMVDCKGYSAAVLESALA